MSAAMSSESRKDGELLRESLGPGKDCLSIEDLGHYLEQKGDQTWRAGVKSHLAGCSHCHTELHLLQEFQAGDVSEQEAAAVQAITRQLAARSSEIFGQSRQPAAHRAPWWKGILTASWLSPAAVALAGILLIAGVGLEIRQRSAPVLRSGSGSGPEVLRSSALTVVAPVGDLTGAPQEVQWQAVAGAAKYQVRLLEVDRSPLWQSETADTHIALPGAVRDRIVPGKTILSEVIALDAAGVKIAASEIVRFRVAPSIH
jgi:hypothetical protein